MKRIKKLFYLCLTFLFLTLFACNQSVSAYAQTNDPITLAPSIQELVSSDTNNESSVSSAPMSTCSDRHCYDSGIYDGATYYLQNVKDGTYLDVDDNLTASGTSISTYTFHGKINQQFKLSYLGMGLYEIIPMNSPSMRVNIQSNTERGDVQISTKSRTSNRQKFKMQMVDYSTAIIYTQTSGFASAICFDKDHPRNVNQRNYNNLSATDKGYAQWQLQPVNDYSYESYNKYYIRNLNTGLYLDVVEKGTSNGTVVHARPFLGNENQEWKLVHDNDNDCYYFKPMHRTDMAMDAYQSHVVIYNDTYPSDQGFRLDLETFESSSKYVYRITTAKSGYTKYLNLGEMMDTNPDYRYVTSGTNSNDLWVLEKVPFDYSGVSRLNVNETYQKSITSYAEQQIFTFRTEVNSRFKVELTRTSGKAIMGLYIDRNATMPEFYHVYNSTDGQALDVFLKADTTYYLFIFDTNYNFNSNYSIRVRQFVATYHSHDFPNDINRISDSSDQMNLLYTHKENMTVARAKKECNEITGLRDFNSEIFVYSGHGSHGYACYDGGNNFSKWFGASELPSMNNCELAIWDCCLSAAANVVIETTSLVDKSIAKGAKTVIGWSESIGSSSAENYMDKFFEQLALGKTVKQASDNSILQNHFASTNVIVSSIKIAGNNDNIIFPIDIYDFEINSLSASINNPSEYTLVNENSEYGAKVYSKLLNGIPTDDFYIEFYNHGKLTNVYKSSYNLTDEIKSSVLEDQSQPYISYSSVNLDQKDLSYAEINGTLRLIQKREIFTEINGINFVKVIFCDVETGELINI